MVLTAVPVAVLWEEVPRRRGLICLALLLLLPPFPFDQPALIGGWRAVLAYPRVAGTALLWLVACGGIRGQTDEISRR